MFKVQIKYINHLEVEIITTMSSISNRLIQKTRH